MSLLQHRHGHFLFATVVWLPIIFVGIFVARWNTLHVFIANGFAYWLLAIAAEADDRKERGTKG